MSGESWGRQTVDAAGSVLPAGRATVGPFREKFRGLALGDEGALFLRASMILGLNSVVSGPGEQGA